MTFISYAQNFEDVMLWRALQHVESGFYIDVGAGHPDDYSVTRAFYDRGWRGINIEPSAQFYPRLAAVRERDINLNKAVGDESGGAVLFEIAESGLSTLVRDIADTHGDAGWRIEQRAIGQITLGEICRRHAPRDIHFLKVDAEGSERAVLASADFTSFRPWIILTEATEPLSQKQNHADWEPIVVAADYRFAWFDGLNRFYIANERWEELSPAFATPPNVFDDFIRATDTEHLNRIVAAEARAAMVGSRLAEADARASEADRLANDAARLASDAARRAIESDRLANQAEQRAAQADVVAQSAEIRATQADSRARSADIQSLEAASRAARTDELMAKTEARAIAAEANALAAEANALAAEAHAAASEATLAELAARHELALAEISALRTSTSWRLSAPLRIVRWLLSAHFGAALIEAGIPAHKIERLKALTSNVIRPVARVNSEIPQLEPGLPDIAMAPEPTILDTVPQKPAFPADDAGRPLRTVHQFHSGSSPGDAITNSMFLLQRTLRDLGYASDIFVEHRHPELADRLFGIDDLPSHGDYILILHHSMGYDACERIASLPAPKILLYHNITPPELLSDFPEYVPYAELGRRQLSLLRPYMAAVLADSEFNALELRKNGYDSPTACPFLLDVDHLIANSLRPSPRPKEDPFTVLFVGRVVASKGQADLVDAFAEFRREWSAPCRLVLIGRMASPDASYPTELRRRIFQHSLQNEVVFTGLASDAELKGWYKAADLYVSLSLHEGFGVPLVEAMAHGIPIVAWPAGAVPYTLGAGGLLLRERSPTAVAAAMLTVARDPGLRESMLSGQKTALDRFRLHRQLPLLTQALMKAGAAPPVEPQERQALSANLRFTITGHVIGTYSLAAVNRRIALSLEAQFPGAVRVIPWENGGIADLSAMPSSVAEPIARLVSRAEHQTGPQLVISQHYPVYVPPRRGDLTVAMVFWEESLLPIDTIRLLNKNFDAIFAPSTVVADALINSGLSIPVRVVGIAPDLVKYRRLGAVRKAYDSNMGRPLTFLHISSCFPRKGVDVLLAAYAESFRKGDPVRLVIKCFENPHNDVSEQVALVRQHHPDLADICVIINDLDDDEMLALYRDADVVVLPTRGEGFNLPAAEAIAAGLPLIVTKHGGHLDFCTEEDARLVAFRFAPSRSHLSGPGSVWAEPDVDDLAAAMRSLFEDIVRGAGECTARAMRASEIIEERLNPEAWAVRTSRTAVELITAPRPQHLRLAWISTWAVRCGIAEYSRSLVESVISRPEATCLSSVVLCDERTPAPAEPKEVRVCPSWRVGDPASMAQLARAISAEDPDIVVIQYHRGIMPWDGLLRLLTDRRLEGRSTIVTLHATPHLLELDPEERKAVATALSRVSRVLVHRVSDLDLLNALGHTRNVALFPHGAPRPVNAPPVRELARRDGPMIGCYGFFLPGKGIPRLIEAVALLRKAWPHLRIRLVNAEYPVPESAEEIARCRALAESLGVSGSIEWHTEFQPLAECFRLLSGCDLLVLPYDHTEESTSAALRTALASGVPTAVTPVTIFEEADEAVYRFAALDVEATAHGIDSVLRNAMLRSSLQQAASTWLAEHDWANLGERMLGMLKGLSQRPCRGTTQNEGHSPPAPASN